MDIYYIHAAAFIFFISYNINKPSTPGASLLKDDLCQQ